MFKKFVSTVEPVVDKIKDPIIQDVARPLLVIAWLIFISSIFGGFFGVIRSAFEMMAKVSG